MTPAPDPTRAEAGYLSHLTGAERRASAPTDPQFDASVVVDREAGRAHITLSGELDIAAFAGARAAGQEALEAGVPIEADLSAITFLDSTGISWLVGLRRDAQARGAAVTVTAASPAVRDVLRTLSLVGLLGA